MTWSIDLSTVRLIISTLWIHLCPAYMELVDQETVYFLRIKSVEAVGTFHWMCYKQFPCERGHVHLVLEVELFKIAAFHPLVVFNLLCIWFWRLTIAGMCISFPSYLNGEGWKLCVSPCRWSSCTKYLSFVDRLLRIIGRNQDYHMQRFLSLNTLTNVVLLSCSRNSLLQL